VADVHRGCVVVQVINAVGHRSSVGILWKVVAIHVQRLLTPNSPSILKITDQLFLFGIDTQTRLRSFFMPGAFRLNVLELPITLRMRLPLDRFAIDAQAVIAPFEQPTNHRQTDWMTERDQMVL